MTKNDTDDLTPEQALERAQESASSGVLAQLGITISTPEQLRLRLAQALVDASTVDDLLAESATTGWGDHEGRSVLIRGVTYAPSTKRSALGFYAIVDAVDVDSSKPLLLTSGGENVVLQLAKLMKLGGQEVPVKLVSNTTGDGNTVHRLVKGETGANAPF